MTRTHLAKAAGVDPHALSDIYYERRLPGEGILQKICDALGVPSSQIIEILPDVPEGQNNKGSAENGNKDKPGKKHGLFGFS